jgi:6-phosphogluconolactonase
MARIVFISSYTKDEGQAAHRPEGIITCQVSDLGELCLVSSAFSGVNPSYLACHPSQPFLYAVNEMEADCASSFAINMQTGALTLLNSQPTGGVWPCHLSLDPSGRWLMVANYQSGSLTTFPILAPDGRLGPASQSLQHQGTQGPDHDRQDNAHAHMVKFDPSGRFVLATDLGLDRFFIYHLDEDLGQLQPTTHGGVVRPPASGPRHFVFHPSGRFLYLANELNSTVAVCSWDSSSGRLQPLQSLPTLPGGIEGFNAVADIHIHPSGRFLYVSNRGHDSLSIYAVNERSGLLYLLGHQPTGGLSPRAFAIDPQGQFILVANQHSGTVVTFSINPHTGMLSNTPFVFSVPQPVCVIFGKRYY